MSPSKEHLNLEFRARLQEEFSRRLRANERYSVRAFAAHIGIDSSSLSQILMGKRMLSAQKIQQITEHLGIQKSNEPTVKEFTQIQEDMFAVIADWYHFAILDLTLLRTFNSSPKWIARKLSISHLQAVGAIERLKRLCLLTEKNGVLEKSKGFYTNYTEGMTSAALKEYQRQVIRKALEAVDGCPQEVKDITSMTIAADSKKIKQAKEKIKNFRRELCTFLEDGNRDSVFHLALQLYPVTKFEN